MNDDTVNGLPSIITLAGTEYRIVEEMGDNLLLVRTVDGENCVLRRFSNDLVETGLRVLVSAHGIPVIASHKGYVRVLILGNVIEDLTGIPAVERRRGMW